jgi:nucleoside-diphosphate-sugar epimerase
MYVGLTGATGRVGRSMARELIVRGHRVRAMVREDRPGGHDDVAELQRWGAEVFEADLGDDRSLRAFVEGPEVVVHAGYHHCAPGEVDEPLRWVELNVCSAVKLLWWHRRAGGRQFIFISSSAVYGIGATVEQRRWGANNRPYDEHTIAVPRSFYGAYKRAVEDQILVFRHETGSSSSTSLRPVSQGLPALLGFRRSGVDGPLVDEVGRLLAGEEVVFRMPPRIVATSGHDLAIGCDALIRGGLVDGVELGPWYNIGSTPISHARFLRVLKEELGCIHARVDVDGSARSTSCEALAALGFAPRGSDVTLREHLREVTARLLR